MKKKRFMKLLALASCVTLLTGCESEAFFGLGKYANKIADWGVGLLEKLGLKEAEKKEEKGSEDKPSGEGEQGGEEEQPKVPSMVVAELPEKLEVGESLDLGEYVTLTNATEFTVSVASASESLASVEGHVLTALGEGLISFRIESGELSQACSIEGYRSSREFLKKYFEGVGNRYTVEVWKPNYTTQQMEYSNTVYHSSNYVLDTQFPIFDDNDQFAGYLPGGFLQFGTEAEECFEYTITGEGENQGVSIMEEYPLMYMSYFNGDFGVDFSQAEYEFDSDYQSDLYVIEGRAATNFAENSFFIINGEVSDGVNDYEIDRVEFELVDVSETEEPEIVVEASLYITYEGESEYLWGGLILVDEKHVGLDDMEAYCVPENKPEGVDYWNYFSNSYGLGDLFLSPSSPNGALGDISIVYGWYDAQGNPLPYRTYTEDGVDYQVQFPESVEQTYFMWLPTGYQDMLTSESSIWTVDYEIENEQIVGLDILKGKMEAEDESDPTSKTVYDLYPTSSGLYAEPDDDHATVWADSDYSFGGLRDRNNWKPGCIAGAQDVYSDPEDQSTYMYTYFAFQNGKVNNLLNSVFSGVDELYVVPIIAANYANHDLDIMPMFSMNMIVVPSSGLIQLSVVFNWDSNAKYKVVLQFSPDASDASLVQYCESLGAAAIAA